MLCDKRLGSDLLELKNLAGDDDLEAYLNWLRDPEINRFLEVRFALPQKVIDLQNYVESINRSSSEALFGIFDKSTRSHIGNIKIGPVNPSHGIADVGLLIGDKNFWGQGLASEAIRLICIYGFDILGLEKITAGCYLDNIGSKKAFLKQGFVEEGRLRNHWLCEGRRQDGILLGKLRSDLPSTSE